MVLVNELSIAGSRMKIGQDEADFILRKLPKQTEDSARQGNADNNVYQRNKPAPFRRVTQQHRCDENERQHPGYPSSRPVRVGTNRMPHRLTQVERFTARPG